MSDPDTIRLYDRQADRYADLTDGHNAADPLLAAFIAACPKGARVLDLGCGPGASAAAMARAGLRVDAIDASAEMVARAGAHEGVTAWRATFDELGQEAIHDGVWANFFRCCTRHGRRCPGILPRSIGRCGRAASSIWRSSWGRASRATGWGGSTPIIPRPSWTVCWPRPGLPFWASGSDRGPALTGRCRTGLR
ncbi:methyltransferase domain-containing protein [Jhaorihella thermophila]